MSLYIIFSLQPCQKWNNSIIIRSIVFIKEKSTFFFVHRKHLFKDEKLSGFENVECEISFDKQSFQIVSKTY